MDGLAPNTSELLVAERFLFGDASPDPVRAPDCQGHL